MTETATQAPPAQLFEVVAETALLAGVSRAELLSPRRDPEIVRWRAAGMAAARVIGDWSKPSIGRAFDRHHTSVLHALALAGVHVVPSRAFVRVDPDIAGRVTLVLAAVAARVAARSRGVLAPGGRLPGGQSPGASNTSAPSGRLPAGESRPLGSPLAGEGATNEEHAA